MGKLENEVLRQQNTLADTCRSMRCRRSARSCHSPRWRRRWENCKEPRYARRRGDEAKRLAASGLEVRVADLETRFLYQRRTLGLKHGAQLFAHLINRINQPIKRWLDVDRANRGGRPPTMVRDYCSSGSLKRRRAY